MKPTVLGVLILARNGHRTGFYQDPYTYEPSFTESTALGAVESFQLGSYLKSTYLDSSSPLHILDMPLDPSHPIPPSQVHVHAKAGGEGATVFHSSIALLQGMFPPTPRNKITLAHGTTITSPLGGYQYVPVEMVPDSSDTVLESWVDCAAFKKHITKVYSSQEFQEKAQEAKHFFGSVHDYVFGCPTTLENIVYNYLNTELVYNQTFAFRLPPTLIEQARALANYHEDTVFSDNEVGALGTVLAGRTILHPILGSLERIAFDDDPPRILLIETSYQPLISLFHMFDVLTSRPDLAGFPNFASALSFELLRRPAPEFRDFVRIKFKNGTDDSEFQTLRVLGHEDEAIPVTEFIYRLEHYAIPNTKQWTSACGNSRWFPFDTTLSTATEQTSMMAVVLGALSLFAFAMFALTTFIKHAMNAKGARRNEAVVQQHGVSIVHSYFLFSSAYQRCNNTTFQNYATFDVSEKAGLLP
ncbi:histidine phosphatase superfamily [Pisolithus marmoratus]|nr:histidine phosphatase superfamily [Pisolithus marmoratus]